MEEKYNRCSKKEGKSVNLSSKMCQFHSNHMDHRTSFSFLNWWSKGLPFPFKTGVLRRSSEVITPYGKAVRKFKAARMIVQNDETDWHEVMKCTRGSSLFWHKKHQLGNDTSHRAFTRRISAVQILPWKSSQMKILTILGNFHSINANRNLDEVDCHSMLAYGIEFQLSRCLFLYYYFFFI